MIKRTHISCLRSVLLLMIIITSSLLPLITFADTTTLSPNGIGNFDAWNVSLGSTKVSAVSSNNGDTSYINSASNNVRQTFAVPGASVPTGSTINSVTINAVAREPGNNSKINLVVEKGTGAGNISSGINQDIDSTYSAFSRSMSTNPFTAALWTVSEVNNWQTGGNNVYFGVEKGNANDARVTQISVVVDYTQSTAVTLLNFIAESNSDGIVTLSWQTATETDNAGFNLYRSRLKDGNYKKLNNALIPSEGNEVEGASYSYEDTPPASSTYYYKLEDVDYDETSTMHGPVKVRVRVRR